ncbi:MAG: FliM/FliN family flagellar motor switch protein [Bacillota bacterium]
MDFSNLTEDDIKKLMAGLAESDSPEVARARFSSLEPVPASVQAKLQWGHLGNVSVSVEVRLGRGHLTVREILDLTEGNVIRLDRLAGEAVDVLINGKLLAAGEVVIVNEVFGIRINSLMLEEKV